MPNRSHTGLMGGLLILAVGVILLLDQQGYVSASHVFRVFWPAFFMLLGLEDLVAGFSPQKRIWGGLLFGGGSLFLLNNLEYIHVRFAILGPLVLIGIGLWTLAWTQGHAPRLFPPHQGGAHQPRQPWIRRGPGGPRTPTGIGGSMGPMGPSGPFAPSGPTAGSGVSAPQTTQQPTGEQSPATGAAQHPTPSPSPMEPGYVPPPMPPFTAASDFTNNAAPPQDWRDWHRWHKQQRRDFKRQMKAWKRGWNPESYWQQQNWAEQQQQPGNQQQPGSPSPTGSGSNDSQFNFSVICSHVERHITSKHFKSGTLSAILGGFEIDLSRADIEGDEAVIYADAFFGGGEIRIPDTWHVVMEGNALFGAFMDETRQRPPEGSAPAKRLIIRGTAVFGGVSIEN